MKKIKFVGLLMVLVFGSGLNCAPRPMAELRDRGWILVRSDDGSVGSLRYVVLPDGEIIQEDLVKAIATSLGISKDRVAGLRSRSGFIDLSRWNDPVDLSDLIADDKFIVVTE